MRTIVFLITLLSVVALSSCHKDPLTTPQPDEQIQNMSQLKVASDFNWKTTREVQVVVTGFVNGLIEVSSAENALYHRAFLKQGQPLAMKLTLPSYEDKVFLNYMGQRIELKLTSNNLKYDFKLGK